MTKKEIIRNLKYTMEKHKNDRVDTFGTNISLMCKDILDYLEQEPCVDCISRQAVIDLVADYDLNMGQVVRGIHALPSVTPQPRSEVLDKIRDEIEAKCCITVGRENDGAITLHDVFEILDKYKAESEDME